MSKIAFLGLGAMGSRMVKHLIHAHEVTVWNRTMSDEVSESWQALGAKVSKTVAIAVQDADFVICMVRDNEASQMVWLGDELKGLKGALSSMPQSCLGIECSTLSKSWFNELKNHFLKQNKTLIDAPLAGSRPQAEAQQLIFFVGGEKHRIEHSRPILSLMGKAVHECGSLGAGMSLKLAINALFASQLEVMAEILGFLKQSQVDLNVALDGIAMTPVCSPIIKVSTEAMIKQQHSPLFPIELVCKDLAYFLDGVENMPYTVSAIESVYNVYEQAKQQGLEHHNITGVAKVFVNPDES